MMSIAGPNSTCDVNSQLLRLDVSQIALYRLYGKFTFASPKYANMYEATKNSTPTGLNITLSLFTLNIVCNMDGRKYVEKTRKSRTYLKTEHNLRSICRNIRDKDNTMFRLVKFIFTSIYLVKLV